MDNKPSNKNPKIFRPRAEGLGKAILKDSFELFQFPYSYGNFELEKLVWLVRLRWSAILLFFTMSIPGYIAGFLDRSSFIVFIGMIAIFGGWQKPRHT